MNNIKIDLKNYKHLGFDEINFDKKINLVFGKNGTGKSTITKEILRQKHYKKIGDDGETTDELSDNQNDKYDVRVFQGFSELFGMNEEMNAFSLEVNATKNQDQIKGKEAEKEKIEGDIAALKKDLVELEDGGYTTQELRSAEDNLGKKEKEIDTQVFSKIVNQVKNIDKTDTQYANSDGKLKADITTVKADNYEQLQKVEKESLNKVIKETTKKAVGDYVADVPNLEDLLIKTNELLQKEVTIFDKCSELDTPEKETFAKEGKELHGVGDACAFCGGIFTAERLSKLNQHFNEEYQALEKSVNDRLESLQDVKLPLLEQADFYANFEVKDLNDDIKDKKTEINAFIGTLRKGLEQKSKNISYIDKIDINIPEIKELQDKIDNFIVKNNTFGKNLDVNKKEAYKKLTLNIVFEKLKELKHDEKNREREKLQENRDKAKSSLDEKLKEKEGLEGSLNNVLAELNNLKPKAEAAAVEKINKKLAQCNFKIKLKDDSYYCLEDDRKLKTLSSGEKNLIAFLYFIEKLEEIPVDGESQKSKIIVFDDPMNSNDDTNQYLIIMELQKIMEDVRDSEDIFVCLTHNMHFYINLKHIFKSYKDIRVQRLVGGQIEIIEKVENDFKTSYESLWRELRFLYESDKPELMLNPIRRICETFEKFNSIGSKEFYKDNSEIKKYIDVNSHSIDDLEADLNGKGKEQIIGMLKKLFDDNNYAGHYSKYWTDESE